MVANEKISLEKKSYPTLPMRDIVVFPHMTTPFFIGRNKSKTALEIALASDRQIFVVAQKDPMVENPELDDLYEIGTIGTVLQVMRLPNGTVKALFEGKERARILKADIEANYYSCILEPLQAVEEKGREIQTLIKAVKSEFVVYSKRVKRTIENIETKIQSVYIAGVLADMIAPLLHMDIKTRQAILEEVNGKERLEKVYTQMLEEEENKDVEKKLRERVQGQIGRTQREYYLNEQMKAIQKELGSSDDAKSDFDEYELKINESTMSKEARGVAQKELKKLKMMPAMSSEANIVRNYLDWMIQLPWKEITEDHFDIDNAQTILDQDHYGLEKVKERIVEYIAVAKMVGKLKGPIICLVGPPGVGKTSLARSVARALGRNFVRMSLGGVRDEAEIRGHRRTYIGALPGKILQSIKKAKSANPVLLLDEIDKMTQNHMGDPASALLEVLDPEQNNTFMDHYLEVEYDLSNVLFLCTANSRQDIPIPLQDRMEIITLSGYTELEKEKIATQYLIPKQQKENGLDKYKLRFNKESLLGVIRYYTKEAGVRSLERNISKICRKVVRDILKKSATQSHAVMITNKRVQRYLGIPIYQFGKIEEKSEIGIATGLAWTAFGGDLLVIEATTMKGTGRLQLTGKLGDVMKESAQAALSYVRSNANSYGIYSHVFKEYDIHVHVPEGAIPKDGPSAGITLTTAIISALSGIPIKKEIAMTGEVTLRGKILPIGGLKEKLLAAKRGMIETVLIPEENRKDLQEIPKEVQDGLIIRPMHNVRDVIKIALECDTQPVRDEDIALEETPNPDMVKPIATIEKSTPSMPAN